MKKLSSVLVGLALVASLSACGSSPSVSKPNDDAKPAAEAEAAAKEGTRENPYPLGSTISGKEWDVVINSVNLDGNAAIAAENQFNSAAPEGQTFILVNATYTYTGETSASPFINTSIDYVAGDNKAYKSSDVSVVTPEAVGFDELFTGGSTTGNTSIAVPVALDGVLRVTADMFGDGVFVAIR
ncbi:hypothetical protein [Lysinibacter cavernae]|uniref:Putative small lipoprotein YifL n=1 Tax=Lysinibacter cavernae TaxID=1640652 RepID=A0A7X5TTB2_9MICO|nr:hypothetical protein [Lysinibacter cavernae]NIH53319.1 putative small lipoprotein YifL [Lysinibacter cavernae]